MSFSGNRNSQSVFNSFTEIFFLIYCLQSVCSQLNGYKKWSDLARLVARTQCQPVSHMQKKNKKKMKK